MKISEVNSFLDEFFARLEKAGVDVTGLEVDHVAYKTDSVEGFFDVRMEFKKLGEQVHENNVRGRRVGVFKLFEPLMYKGLTIPAIELIAPKEGEEGKSGWEHAEIVLSESYESFMSKYPDLNWDTSIMNSDLFSMIKLKLGEDMQAKFHLMPILEIIKSEN